MKEIQLIIKEVIIQKIKSIQSKQYSLLYKKLEESLKEVREESIFQGSCTFEQDYVLFSSSQSKSQRFLSFLLMCGKRISIYLMKQLNNTEYDFFIYGSFMFLKREIGGEKPPFLQNTNRITHF
ncbi:unnamed protein product [Paramecium primaurelia]|uniref:Uncharacterized protein n=1 Tax=Paramecium primaurelia TaxID=5886 RepID=A0A8S1LY30_PARPR|nr:unnamed protein product [Paramecium primaurelia]